jgi:hypothetical protein
MAIHCISKHSVLELVNNAGNLLHPVILFFYIFRLFVICGLFVIRVVLLLIVMFYVLFMCKYVLPPTRFQICYLCCFFVIRVVLLLVVMFYVLFMCKCVLPPGANPITLDKYININININIITSVKSISNWNCVPSKTYVIQFVCWMARYFFLKQVEMFEFKKNRFSYWTNINQDKTGLHHYTSNNQTNRIIKTPKAHVQYSFLT